MFLFMCGAAQLLTDGYMKSTTLLDYFSLSADYKTGGGLIGGAICISITSAFGTIGGYVIIILAFVVCMIIITQRSLLDFITMIVIKICDFVKEGHTRYVQGQPERAMRREERAVNASLCVKKDVKNESADWKRRSEMMRFQKMISFLIRLKRKK